MDLGAIFAFLPRGRGHAEAAEGDGEQSADDREGEQQLDECEAGLPSRSAFDAAGESMKVLPRPDHRTPVGGGVCVAGLWAPVAGAAGTCVALAFTAACSSIADVVRSVATSTS